MAPAPSMYSEREALRKERATTGGGVFHRTWGVLQFLIEQPSAVSAVTVAEATELPLPTAMRLLSNLASDGLVDLDAGRRLYWPGPALLRMLALAGRSGWYSDLISAPLKALATATGETACLNVLMPTDQFSLVASEEGTQPLRYVVELGGLHGLDRGAGGKAILAFLPAERQERIIAVAGDAKALRISIAEIQQSRVATTMSERVVGAVGVAMPVFGPGGLVWGSVQVTIPEHRFQEKSLPDLAAALAQAAAKIAFDQPQRDISRES